MKIEFLTRRKPTLSFVVAAMLFSSLVVNGAVRPLDENELAKITGSWYYLCKPRGGACQDKTVTCALPGQVCKGHCAHRYQNWSCGLSIYGSGCETDPPRECGMQPTGLCDENKNCVYDPTADKNCGTATDCHNT